MRVATFLITLILLTAGVARCEVDYVKDIKPFLKARCYACHGALKHKSNLRVDSVASMREGGEEGNILTGDSSLLLQRISQSDEHLRMPPEGAALTAAEIARIKDWIAAGAKGPSDEKPEPDPRLHWAYRVPVRAGADVDSLLNARLAAKGFKRQLDATPETWMRRVYLDLIGLPPTPEQLRTFRKDSEANAESARAKTVDALLASPQYGERWARHFMDIWRYCDWHGLDAQLRHSQKHIWHWRDWIVEALNADTGYDQMMIAMLAADEATPSDRSALRATGFLCRNYYLFNRTTWLDDTIEHTSRAFLGVSMQCAKCHDHKYDPVSQADYYRMRAIFEPYHVRLDPEPGEGDLEKNGLPRVFDLHLDRATFVHVRGDDKNEDKSRVMTPGAPAVLSFTDFKPTPIELPASSRIPGTLPFVLADQLAAAERSISTAQTALDAARKTLSDLSAKKETASTYEPAKGVSKTAPSTTTLESAEAAVAAAEKALAAAQAKLATLRAIYAADMASAEKTPPQNLDVLRIAAAKAEADEQVALAESTLAQARKTALSSAKKGDAEKKVKDAESALSTAKKKAATPGKTYSSMRVTMKAQEGPDDKKNLEMQTYPATSTGRRLAFAKWLADTRNPLTARVLVNHVWTRHFGASLVPDVTDFGLRCPAPLQQDVLDSLAVDFMEHGWSIKRLHRQLVLSALYRVGSSTSQADATTLTADPENAYYWRMNPRRLESQAIRDSVVSIGGKLDLKMGGPSIESNNDTSPRRALYFVQDADKENRFLGALDNANVLECYRRQESIVPQQALALANSKLTRECAATVATRTMALDQKAFVAEAFLLILGRFPTTDEDTASAENLAVLLALQKSKPDPQRARTLFVQALLCHNDFVTIR
ncbi:MAG: DUF1553 domain-containing protein [Planctomycetota bacterium]